ncbi:hypothetical protein AZJ48_03255 [Streptococcus pneumoniae]|nr:hypothetical protein AZJ48_03255 [Streptococcus pneumoniae]
MNISIRKVKLIYRNILSVKMYCYRFNTLYFFNLIHYSEMKQEQDKSIRTVKSISNNVLEAEVYYSSFNLL